MKPHVILVGGDGRPSGVPRHILQLSRALADMADVTVVSDEDCGGYTDLRTSAAKHQVVRGLTNSASPLRLLRGALGLLRTFKSEKPNVIWIHARLPMMMMRFFLVVGIWRPQCAIIFTHHGLPYGRGFHPVVNALGKALEKFLLGCSPPQDIVFLNNKMAGWMARDARAARLTRHRVHILPNCSDLGPLPQERDPKRINLVMTGRTGRQKDYDFAAKFMAHLPQSYHLTLCGPGTETARFHRRVAGIVTPDVFARIDFAGPLPNARRALQGADAYLLTSRYEGTPIGALEAFEAGLPIILRDFDGAKDLVGQHPCGLLISDRNLQKAAVEIDALIQRFYEDADHLRSRTRAVWRKNWSPDLFHQNATALVRSVLVRSGYPLMPSGYVRDAQVRHPDPCKNAIAPPPIRQPDHTGVSP
ncbi:MAG: glycosyltransferase family 4 protein [Sulfitobacter sp.]